MASQSLLGRLRTLDVRIWAAAGAALLLIVGVMWVVPTTPNSNSFTFDTARRDMSNARAIELGKSVQGNLEDGSDVDFYRIGAASASTRLDVRMTNGSRKMIPGLRIYDAARNLVQDNAPNFIRSPGADIETSFDAHPNTAYFVAVFGQLNTTGPYTLQIRMRP